MDRKEAMKVIQGLVAKYDLSVSEVLDRIERENLSKPVEEKV